MSFIKALIKAKILFIIIILLFIQFVTGSQNSLPVAANNPVELSVAAPNGVTAGETFTLTIEKNQTDTSSSTIQFPSNVKVDLANIENTIVADVTYKSETNHMIIDWAAEAETADIKIDVIIINEEDIEITSNHYLNEEISFFHSLFLTADAHSEEPEEEPFEDVEEPESTQEHEKKVPTETEEQPSDEVKSTEENAFRILETRSEESIKKLNTTEELLEQESASIEDNIEKLAEHEVLDATLKSAHKDEIQAANIVTVRSWDNFVAELRNPQTEEIYVLSNLNAPIQSQQQIIVNANKKIVGFGNTIDFRNYVVSIGSTILTVENLKIRAEQSELTTEASVFYSNHANAVLHLINTSFDGVQSAQVAHLMNGHIRISGTVRFETRNAFEIFEAKNITFEENASFIGAATGPIAVSRKELLNLYNSPQMTIRKNANVRLLTNSKNSIIAVKDGSAASITILENGKLEIIADTMNTTSGDPLIHLPGGLSTVSVAQNATLDIQNLREVSAPGGLMNMNGQVTLPTRSKVAFWDKGGNVNLPSGNYYRYFPNVIDGRFFLTNNLILTGIANAQSSSSVSDNPGKNGRTFRDTFTNRNTAEMKRLLITPSEKPAKPIINPMNDQDTVISGQATPGFSVKIIDKTNNRTWLTTANQTTGLFSATLTPYAPYKSGTVLHAVAINAYGEESEEAAVTVTGTTLTLSVPKTMPFQVTPIGFNEVLIPRQIPDWTMIIQDTRGQGSRWRITAKATAPLRTESGETLPSDALIFRKDQREQLLKDSVLIEEGTTGTSEETIIQWHEEEGIFIKLNPIEARVRPNQTYTTTIQWTIENAP